MNIPLKHKRDDKTFNNSQDSLNDSLQARIDPQLNNVVLSDPRNVANDAKYPNHHHEYTPTLWS